VKTRLDIGAALLFFSFVLTGCGDEPRPPAKPPVKPPTATACPDKAPPLDADPRSAAALDGKVVERVCVIGATLTPEGQAEVTKAIVTKPGDKIDANKVRDDITALVKLQLLDDVSVFAEPVGDKGVVLVYDVKERPRIAEVVFEGAQVMNQAGLAGKIPLEKKRPLDRSEVRALVNALRDEYSHRGYGGAKVDAVIEPAPNGTVRVRFVIVEGPQWKLTKVVFKGAQKIKEADLKKAADLLEGTAFDDEKVEKAALALSALYFDRGLLEVRIDDPKKDAATDGAVTLTFNITEGEVYKVGTIKIGKLGEKLDKELQAKMKTKPKAVFDRSVLLADVERIKETFKAKNQKVEVLPRTELDSKTHTVNLLLDVEEAK
jgi:outer membrane protein assembly factor BamA